MMRSATKRRLAAMLAALLLLCGCDRYQESAPKPTTTAPSATSATGADTTTVPTTTTTRYWNPDTPYPAQMRLRVTGLSQFPLYPTGCESVTAVMALRHAGEPVTVEDFVEHCLEKDTNFYYDERYFHGPDPRLVFAGDPRTTSSYGCMAPVIEKALVRYLGSHERVENATGATMQELCQRYVAKGIPVCVWVSINMLEIIPTDTWITPEGETYTWPGNEHCMLLVGYDETHYYFNDPWKGEEVSYPRQLSEQRYETMGRQALVVFPE